MGAGGRKWDSGRWEKVSGTGGGKGRENKTEVRYNRADRGQRKKSHTELQGTERGRKIMTKEAHVYDKMRRKYNKRHKRRVKKDKKQAQKGQINNW